MSSQTSAYSGNGRQAFDESIWADVRVTASKTAKKVQFIGGFKHSDAIFRWCDQEAGLKVLGFGCFAISTSADAFQQPLEFVIGGVHVDADDLFTYIKTKLDESLWAMPIGFFALRFDSERDSQSSLWCEWPAAIVQIPEQIIVEKEGRETVDIRFELVSQSHPLANGNNKSVTTRSERQFECTRWSSNQKWDEAEDSTHFQDRVFAVEAACRNELVDKIVLARSASVRCEPQQSFCPQKTYDALVDKHPKTTVFSIRRGSQHFMGATPETLVRVTGYEVTTHALAGTATHDPEAMLVDDKIRREHAYVVGEIQSGLEPLCDALQIEPAPSIRPANHLFHLQTKLVGVPKAGYSIFDFVRALHPTPALCGLPRQDSMSWLRKTEPLDRGFFGGPVGLFDASGQNGTCAVAIRSGLLGLNQAVGFAGAGIVSGSNPVEEWTETEAKLDAFRSALRTMKRPDSEDAVRQ
ncbi:MAG: isochorismate synthase [Myxococcota bacterium]|nr:isochorismate synthase [Myxococcota bacterium]